MREQTLEDEEAEVRERMIREWRKMGEGMCETSGEFDGFPIHGTMLEGADEDEVERAWKVHVLRNHDLDFAREQDSEANKTPTAAEIKAVLLASLEEKVASLDEDGWMFGDEEKDEE